MSAATLDDSVAEPGPEPVPGGRGDPAVAARRPAAFGRVALAVLVLASSLFAATALHQAWTDGPTFDEGAELAAGLTALTRHDLRANPDHPPLFRTLAAAPVLLLGPHIPRGEAWDRSDGKGLGRDLVEHEALRGRLQRELFVARLLPVLETIVIAWLLALLARRLFDHEGAGVFAAVLWLANPLVIGLGHIDGIDIPATLTTVLSAVAVLGARRTPTTRNAALVGLCAGLAILARLTGVLVLVTAVAAVVSVDWRGDRRRAVRAGLVVAAVAWATVVATYAVLAPGDLVGGATGPLAPLVVLANLLVPPAWLEGTRHLHEVGNVPARSFVLGRSHTGRWLWFWPAGLVVKLPPTTLAVLVAAPLACARLPRPARREALWVLVLPATALTLFTIQQPRAMGVRYLLPALALWLVAASALVVVVGPVTRRVVVTVAVAGALLAATATPSLSWTNPLLGPGYRVATDSNLDWGQSSTALAAWSGEHRPWVAFFGAPGMAQALPGARDIREAPEGVTGWVAVSASVLTSLDQDPLGWLRAYCPVAVLDRTILLYRFTSPPDRQARGPDVPPPVCRGPVSQRRSFRQAPRRPTFDPSEWLREFQRDAPSGLSRARGQ